MKKRILLILVVASMASTAWGQVITYGDSNYMFHRLDTFPPFLSNGASCYVAYGSSNVYEGSYTMGRMYVSDTEEHICGIAITCDTILHTRKGTVRDESLSLMLYLYQVPQGTSDFTLLDSIVLSVTMPYYRKFVYQGIDTLCPVPLTVDTVPVYERLFTHEYVIPAGDSVLVAYRGMSPPPGMVEDWTSLAVYTQSIWDLPPEAHRRYIRDGKLICDYGGSLGPIYPIRHRACPALSGVRVDTVDGTTVCLSWPSEGEGQHYRVEYGPEGFRYGAGAYGTGIVVDNISDTSVCLSGLASETVYTFFVSSYCGEMQQYGMPDSVRVLTNHNAACAQPMGFRMMGRTENSMKLQWDTVAEQQEFEMLVKRSDDGSEQRIRPDSNPYELTDLAAGVVYSVWLRARCHHECVVHDTVLWSPWSGPLQFRLTPQGVEEVVGGLKATLVPNPARGIFTVELAEEAGTPGIGSTVTVTDMAGRVLLTAPLLSARQLVDASALPAGTYFVTLATPQGSSTQKLILE